MFSTFSTFLWGATPVFVTLMSFVLFVALGNDLTAARAFTSLSLFNIMRFPLNMLPASITRIIDLSVVNRRLDRFMNTPELEATTDDGVTWDHVWAEWGDQGDGWQVAHVDVAMYVHRVRFVGTSAASDTQTAYGGGLGVRVQDGVLVPPGVDALSACTVHRQGRG